MVKYRVLDLEECFASDHPSCPYSYDTPDCLTLFIFVQFEHFGFKSVPDMFEHEHIWIIVAVGVVRKCTISRSKQYIWKMSNVAM